MWRKGAWWRWYTHYLLVSHRNNHDHAHRKAADIREGGGRWWWWDQNMHLNLGFFFLSSETCAKILVGKREKREREREKRAVDFIIHILLLSKDYKRRAKAGALNHHRHHHHPSLPPTNYIYINIYVSFSIFKILIIMKIYLFIYILLKNI